MKPSLLVGLGNPLAGDDGIGWYVVERLVYDRRVPEDTEVLWGGTDLFRQAERMEGRNRVYLVDAILDDLEPGTISVLEDGLLELEDERECAHHLSVIEAVKLLRKVVPSLAAIRITLIVISINSAHTVPQLSPALAEKLPEILHHIVMELSRG